jgi:putative thiamine transport system ATP-binding protein
MIKGLTLKGIRLGLNGTALLSLDADIASGEVLTVMGPSGSGKSSLLAYIAGFLDREFHAEGRILLDGMDVTTLPAEQRRIGLLFQDPMLFPHLSVLGNLLFGLQPKLAGRRARAEAALVEVGLEGFGARDPATLSGGQKARVALMRLLLSEPCAVLLDEPFSKLDAHLKGEIRALVFDRLRARGLPGLLVTHDEADALAVEGRILRI